MLKKLLAQHIKKHQKKNLTQAELFSEMLDKRLADVLIPEVLFVAPCVIVHGFL